MKSEIETPVWSCRTCGKRTVNTEAPTLPPCVKCGGRYFKFSGVAFKEEREGHELQPVYLPTGLVVSLTLFACLLLYFAVHP